MNSRNCFDFDYVQLEWGLLLITTSLDSLEVVFKNGKWIKTIGEINKVNTTETVDMVIEETTSMWAAGKLNQSYLKENKFEKDLLYRQQEAEWDNASEPIWDKRITENKRSNNSFWDELIDLLKRKGSSSTI